MATVETHTHTNTQTHRHATQTHRHAQAHTHRHMHMHMQALEVLLWCTRGSDGSRGALKRLSGAQGALKGLSRDSQETLVCSSLFSKTHAGFRGALTTHTHACLPACLLFLHVFFFVVSATLQPQGPFPKVHSYVLNEALRVRHA